MKRILEVCMPIDKKAIRRAGENLINPETPFEGVVEALNTLSDWRLLHAYPLTILANKFRNHIKRKGYKNVIVAQRIKRLPSILNKLKRFHTMKLDRMQDIGGIRCVFNSLNDLRRFQDYAVKSKGSTRLKKPGKDYIANPKPDGYKSVHLVFCYNSPEHTEYEGILLELQLRTKLQHAWATAVETLGFIEKSSFKTGEGDEQYKEFFRLCSALFSIAEKTPLVEGYEKLSQKDLMHRLKTLEEELQILNKLSGIAVSARHIEVNTDKKAPYYVLELDSLKSKVTITAFQNSRDAEIFYAAKEKGNENSNKISSSVVLVSIDSLENLRKAYPNYFLDTAFFIKKLSELLL